MYSDKSRTQSESGTGLEESGYTLVEVLITMVILGMILLVINLVLIAMIRVSYNTDVRIKMRQGIEFAFEVMRRNAKSTDPGTMKMGSGNGTAGSLVLFLPSENGEEAVFFLEEDSETDNGVLKAAWTTETATGKEVRTVCLTSPDEIDVKDFDVVVSNSKAGGTTEVVLTVTADSMNRRNSGEPLIEDLVYQTTIVARYREI
jgi:prepilin-type N-terminal cleavage/methylation domain-containing protein